MSSNPFPEVSAGLITTLEKYFPDKAPRTDVGSFAFGERAGEQRVIDLLRRHFEKQHKEIAHVPAQNAEATARSDPRSSTGSAISSR